MKSKSGIKITLAGLVAGLIAVGGACGSSNLVGPENELEVSNATDNFEFQVSDLDNVTQTLSYAWENTGTQATIDISQSLTAGTAVLTIRDADGTVVYQEDLGDDNDTDTDVGVAGNWGIEVRFDGSTGTVNFRVQRRT